MIQNIKRLLYFPVASYFRFFASIRLRIWNPKVIVVTGSSGKTTLLHLIESQLGDLAKYSHEANSSFGIPFDILGIHRKNLIPSEWFKIFLSPFVYIFKPVPNENIYVVEADCDRPGEGKFLSELLKPDITLWTNVSRTHSMNFQNMIENGNFNSVEEAIAYEFGYFAESTKSLVILNADSELISGQIKRVNCKIKNISSIHSLKKYDLTINGTKFETNMGNFNFPYLLPKEILSSILMSVSLMNYLDFSIDKKFTKFKLPPGRNSCFKGIKKTTLIDSTYNANLDSMEAIINMFSQIDSANKWIVLGDMLEQGKFEKEEHEKLANIIMKNKFNKLILMGSRVTKYTYPKLERMQVDSSKIKNFLKPNEVFDYLLKNITGGETILFKGARFLEGVVEKLLLNKNEAKYLARREKAWEIRRKKWGL